MKMFSAIDPDLTLTRKKVFFCSRSALLCAREKQCQNGKLTLRTDETARLDNLD
jgi:phosphoribosyl-dephospho-CoA transferase